MLADIYTMSSAEKEQKLLHCRGQHVKSACVFNHLSCRLHRDQSRRPLCVSEIQLARVQSVYVCVCEADEQKISRVCVDPSRGRSIICLFSSVITNSADRLHGGDPLTAAPEWSVVVSEDYFDESAVPWLRCASGLPARLSCGTR